MTEPANISVYPTKPIEEIRALMLRPKDRLLSELSRRRDAIIEKLDGVSVRLEHQMNPGVAAGLDGEDRAKARELFLAQAKRIEALLNQLDKAAENFRTHIH